MQNRPVALNEEKTSLIWTIPEQTDNKLMWSSVHICPKSQVTHPVWVLQLHKLISLSDRNISVSLFISEVSPPTWSSCNIDLHRYPWWVVQCRNIRSELGLCRSLTFFPVKFGDPLVIMFSILIQFQPLQPSWHSVIQVRSLYCPHHSGKKALPYFKPWIPWIKISGWAISLITVLSSSVMVNR